MKKIFLPLALIMLLCMVSCNMPGSATATQPPAEDPHALETLVARSITETLAAAVTQAPSQTPQPSDTPQPTFTFTLAVPMVSVSVETNCRSGPGTVYEVISVLLVGQSAEVVGRSPSGDNWIIRPPATPAVTCWLWGQYATVVGNTTGLPIINPPPTPTPAASFTVTYLGVVSCAPEYAFRFNITNNGSITWESIRIIVTDTTTSTSFTHTYDGFRSYLPCVLEIDQQDLAPGEGGPVANVNPGQLNYNPAGHAFTANIKICSQNALAGQCLEKNISFNP